MNQYKKFINIYSGYGVIFDQLDVHNDIFSSISKYYFLVNIGYIFKKF